MANKEVQERCNLVIKQNKKYKEHIEKYTTINKKITITDFRSFNIAPKGNRFLIYSIFPESIVSVKIRFDKDNKEKVILSLGQNIFNRKCKINLGTLAAKYDGGGHQGAGSCSFHINDSEKKIAEIIEILKKNEDIDI